MVHQPETGGPTGGGSPRVYLDVPYRDKDTAKQAGARWDPTVRRWYDPHPLTPGLQQWAARPDIPEVLPGEDRSFGHGLFVDLVPSSCWFTNVRSCVTDVDWERLRRPILARAAHRCEACDAAENRGGGRGLEVHERWHYDYQRNIQSLRRLIALCSACHSTTHLGHAVVTGRDREAIAHLQTVTGMSGTQVDEHITAAYRVWEIRSVIDWELDLSILTGAGIQLRPPPTGAERGDIAEQQLVNTRAEDAATPTERGGSPTQPDPPGPAALPAPEAARRASPDDELARRLADTAWHGGPDDLARNAPGIGLTHEATRRRQLEGAGADRSWRVGADGEAAVAAVLAKLTTPSPVDRLRRRAPAWSVLHSVPVGTGRGDIDHVLIGPPGVVTINTKHHRAGRLSLDGDELIVNGRPSDYIPKARREAQRAAELLTAALAAVGQHELAAQLRVRAVLAVVGGRVLVNQWAPGVAVVMTGQLLHTLSSMPAALDPTQVQTVHGIARYRAVWARPLP